MSTFLFFPNRKKTISRLVKQGQLLTNAESKQDFAGQVREVFEPLIERLLSKAERADGPLQQTIFFELCGLITTLPVWDTYFVNHHEQVLDDLINACRWKLRIKVAPFNKLTQLDKLVQNSITRQADVRRWVGRIREDPQMNRLKRLAAMLTEDDNQAIAYRTVRAFLYCLLNGKQKIDTEFMFWLRDDQVELRPVLAKEYLFDQIALRVYLFHTMQEADFIEEALSVIKQWINSKVAKQAGEITPELEEGIKDIVSEVKMDFIKKCQRIKDEPETLWLDVKFTTYLFAFVKQSHAIDKLLGKQRADEPVDKNVIYDLDSPTGGEIGTPDPEPFGNGGFSSDDPLDELKSKLYEGLARIEDKCKKLILSHFNDNFGDTVPFQTLAFEYNEPAKTLESRFEACMKKLKAAINGIL